VGGDPERGSIPQQSMIVGNAKNLLVLAILPYMVGSVAK